MTCCPLSIHDPPVLCGNWLEHNAVDDAQEDDRGVQGAQHVLDAKLVARMASQFVENESAAGTGHELLLLPKHFACKLKAVLQRNSIFFSDYPKAAVRA